MAAATSSAGRLVGEHLERGARVFGGAVRTRLRQPSILTSSSPCTRYEGFGSAIAASLDHRSERIAGPRRHRGSASRPRRGRCGRPAALPHAAPPRGGVRMPVAVLRAYRDHGSHRAQPLEQSWPCPRRRCRDVRPSGPRPVGSGSAAVTSLSASAGSSTSSPRYERWTTAARRFGSTPCAGSSADRGARTSNRSAAAEPEALSGRGRERRGPRGRAARPTMRRWSAPSDGWPPSTRTSTGKRASTAMRPP